MDLDLRHTQGLQLAQNLRVGREETLDQLSAFDPIFLGETDYSVGTCNIRLKNASYLLCMYLMH